MLGELDPSHIIRAIEYWDIERIRFPKRIHRAVIIAEEITSRFSSQNAGEKKPDVTIDAATDLRKFGDS
jgi:hypothetical protein